MSFDWHPIAVSAIQVLSPVVMAGIAALFAALTRRVLALRVSEQTQTVLAKLDDTVELAVTDVAQTVIDSALKAAGSAALPKDVASAALASALDKVKTYTPEKDMDLVCKVFGLDTPEELGRFLVSKIEAQVRNSK